MNKDPFKTLAGVLDDRIRDFASGATQGIPCELGTMTAGGVKLDRFKHEIQDPLVLEPVIDYDIEFSLEVPAHEETGTIVLPEIPTNEMPPLHMTKAGEYQVTYKFNPWYYDAGTLGKIKATKVRLKYKPEYKPGDRVLCALVNGGQDLVIISRVIPYA